MPSPVLIITVDTEEEGLWGADESYKSSGNTVENLKGIRRFQSICDKYDAPPTYLVDLPVVEDDYGASLIRDIQMDGRCEVGAHLHPWCCPPFEEELGARNSFTSNLPVDLATRKLKHLTEAIAERFGSSPTSYRAGRYGFSMANAKALSQLGYIVDSSVIPFTSYAPDGPDFRSAPFTPYYLDGDELLEPNSSGFLLEVPVTVGFNRSSFRLGSQFIEFCKNSPLRRLRLIGILSRLGVLRRIKFSPEQATSRDMNTLADVMIRIGAPCMVMMMHSSSFVVGHSPYCKTAQALESFYANLDETIGYCTRSLGMKTATLTQFAKLFKNGTQ